MSATADRLADLRVALDGLETDTARIDHWGECIGEHLARGGRLLAAGNGGSAAHASHLSAELVGRFDGDRRPLAAIALGAELPTTTAILNDYGGHDIFVRSVQAHGRRGDVLIALSTSGRSANVCAAATVARGLGMSTLALTGRGPNPLADLCDDAVTVDAASTATVQEVHQVVIHLLCAGIDRAVHRHDLDGGRQP